MSTRSAPDSSDELDEALGAGEHLAVGPRLGGAGGGVGVGERDPAHAVADGLFDERLPGARGAQADDLEIVGARDHVERLGADRPGGAEHEETAGHVLTKGSRGHLNAGSRPAALLPRDVLAVDRVVVAVHGGVVVPRPAIDGVLAAADGGEPIVAAVAVQVVGVEAAVEPVIASVAVQDVSPATALERVVARATVERVVAGAPVELVVAVLAVEAVVAALALELVEAAPAWIASSPSFPSRMSSVALPFMSSSPVVP